MAGLQCFGCGQGFGFFRREHGCKKCGRLFCSGCTSQSIILPQHGSKKMKVCDQCYRNLTRDSQKQTQTRDRSDLNDLNKNTALHRPVLSTYEKGDPQDGLEKTVITRAESLEHENSSIDPDEAIRQRLAELRANDSCKDKDNSSISQITDQQLGERFENLTGRKAISMQNSNINTLQPKKSEIEEVSNLMKQMLEENKLAEEDPTAKSSIIDKEIEERLAKLKGINPSLTNQPKSNMFDSDEDDETASQQYLKQILGEVALDLKMENIDCGDTSASKSSKSRKKTGQSKTKDMDFSAMPSSIFSHDYEANSDDEELPWCCICNGNAVLRCHGCDDDLYCRRCYREGHGREDYEDHDISEYKPPRKKR